MQRILYIIAAALLTSLQSTAQGLDPQFSIYDMQPLNVNPALTGNSEAKWRAQFAWREQSYIISQPYRTGTGSFDINLPINAWSGNIWGFGLHVVNDDQGDTRLVNRRVNLSFSLGQYLDPRQMHSISVGFQGGLGQRSLTYDNVYWDNQWVGQGFNPDLESNENLPSAVQGYLDLSTGLQYTFDGELMDLTGGYAMYHFNRPDASLYIDSANAFLDRRHTVHGSMEHRLYKDNMLSLKPMFVYTRQERTNNLIFGTEFIRYFNEPTRVTGKRKEYSMSLGIYHRWQKDMIASLRFNLAGIVFGYSYDFSVGNMNKINDYQGAYEIFFGYRAGFRKGSNSKYMPHRKGKL